MRSWIIAAALVASGEARADELARAPVCHRVLPYLEPTYFLGSDVGLHRLAAGVVLSDCLGRERPLHAQLGPTVHFASDELLNTAYGAEAEVGVHLSPVWRAGLRLGFEISEKDQYLGTLGLRFRAGDLLILGIDVYRSGYHSAYDFPTPPLEHRWGVMAGLGFEGKLGAFVVAAETIFVLGAIALSPPS
jgi:hypothetical protein